MSSKIALQLYSVRRELDKDFIGTLRKIREIGYKYVETAGYYGSSFEYTKGVFEALDINVLSRHISKETVENDPLRIINECKALDCRYVAIPYLFRHFHAGGDRFTEAVDFFNNTGNLFYENGIQLLFHNHDTEFSEKVNGDYLLDVLYNSVDSRYVKAEIDTCWASYKGVDIVNYIGRYKNRLPIVHLKDYVTFDCEEDGETKRRMHTCAFGDGELDLVNIIRAAKNAGSGIFVVEQDEPYGKMDIFECLKLNYDKLNSYL